MNFTIFQSKRVSEQQFCCKMAKRSPKWKNALWNKEKLLVMVNFSYSHSVFQRLVLQTGLSKKGLRSKLNYYTKIPKFDPSRNSKTAI